MKFGIISTANIGTETVIPAIQETEHEVVAIASRNRARAQEVAEQLGIPRAYETYEELLDDDDDELWSIKTAASSTTAGASSESC